MKKTYKKKFIKLITTVFILVFMVFFSLFILSKDGKISKPLFCQLSKISFINKALSESCPAGQYWKCYGCYPEGYSACTDSHNLCIVCEKGWTCGHASNGNPQCQPPSGGGTGSGGTGGGSSDCSGCSFDINANPATITAGQCTTVTWDSGPLGNWVLGASENIWTGDIKGSQQKCPTSTTTYSLGIMCKNSCGQKTDSTTVTVNPAPTSQPSSPTTSQNAPAITSFSANPTFINQGGSSTLNWSTSNATAVTLTAKTVSGTVTKITNCSVGQCFTNTVGTNGSIVLSPNETTTYTLSAQNSSSTAENSVTVTVASSAPVTNQPAPSINTPPVTACNTNIIPRCMNYSCSGGQWVCQGLAEPPNTSGQTTPQPIGSQPTSEYTFTMTKNYCGTNGQISEFTTTVPSSLYNGIDVRLTADNVGVVQDEKKQSYSISRSGYQDLSDKRFTQIYFDLMYGNAFTDPNIKWATPVSGNGATVGQIPAGLLPVPHSALVVPILDCPVPSVSQPPSLSTTPSPTPASSSEPAKSIIITPNQSSTESSQSESQCQKIDIEGIVKFDQIKNQYFIVKNDNTDIYLSTDPQITINLANYLNHKVKATGCLNNNILVISKIDVTDDSNGNKAGSMTASSATVNTNKLVSTGGSLWFNILVALLGAGIIAYFVLKPGKRNDY